MGYSFDEAYLRIMDATGATTQVALAEVFGVRQSSVSDAKARGEAIPASWLVALVEKYGVNPLWVKTGEGSKYLIPSNILPTSPYTVATTEIIETIVAQVVAQVITPKNEVDHVQ